MELKHKVTIRASSSPQATHPFHVLDVDFAAAGGKVYIQHKTPANCVECRFIEHVQ